MMRNETDSERRVSKLYVVTSGEEPEPAHAA